MSAVKDLFDQIMKAIDKKTKKAGTNYTGKVTRVEGDTAFVQFDGSTINDTPVKMSIDAKPGDSVRIMVQGGKAWLTGNDTAPPTNDREIIEAVKEEIRAEEQTVNNVQREVRDTAGIAANTNQYFWHTAEGSDTGAHITEKKREDFIKNPSQGGGNLLARSNGVAIRDGLKEIAQLRADGVAFLDAYDAEIFDVDTDGELAPIRLAETHTLTLRPNVPVTTVIESPYFSDFVSGSCETSVGMGESFVYVTGEYTSDFTDWVYANTLKVEYSYRNKSFTYTYVGSSQVEIWCQYIWQSTVRTVSISFGGRYGTKGAYTSVFGQGLKAESAWQTALGRFNENNPLNILEVGGGLYDSARYNLLELKDHSGDLWILGSYSNTSDKRLKEHLEYISAEKAGDFIRQLKPAAFLLNKKKHVGFYAQDVEEADPWQCMVGESTNGYKTLGYTEIIAPLVALVQEQQVLIQELIDRIDMLERRVDDGK